MLSFRRARLDDTDLLLRWHNDPLTRSMSKHAERVTAKDYRAWLSLRLLDRATTFIIVERDQMPVASFRINANLLTYQVSPDFRRLGIATELLKVVKQIYGPVRAEIYADNVFSIKAATNAGLEVALISRGWNDRDIVAAADRPARDD